ncbi:MAG: protein-L-isoaspartate O-methyltransferase [Candidatus Berkiellales bacterium]
MVESTLNRLEKNIQLTALELPMNFQQARANMVVQQVRPWQVFDDNVLAALSVVPRENFVPPEYLNLAYSDTDIPLSEGQTMLPPKTVGRALQALNFNGQEKVLEIGTGTGYVTACLAKLVNAVISIEIQPGLLSQAEKNLGKMNFRNLTLEQGNAVYGWEEYAPYDAIIVTGSYPIGVPEKVCDQLKVTGGRLFAICGLGPSMEAVMIERQGENFRTQTLFETNVPALIHAPSPPKFVF